MVSKENTIQLKHLGINTYKEAVIYMHANSPVCRSEGFEVHARIRVRLGSKSILATLNTIDNALLAEDEASLSLYAWELLNAQEGDVVSLEHPRPLQSLSFMRSKVYGNELNQHEIEQIIHDIAQGRYSDIHIAAFLTACANGRLTPREIIILTEAMIKAGERITWPGEMVMDKHCVGGLPGNRTTPIVVPIITAFGLTMPKTSSRAITSPAGTADTMEVLAPVDLTLAQMRRVVEQEQGCIVWGGQVGLSPADDILIRVERVLDLDTEGQLIASVLSKKIAAGSTHIVIDMPVGPTAKVRSLSAAQNLERLFQQVSEALDIHVSIALSDGSQPVGYGIGPALEAQDVLAVLQNHSHAPHDLRQRALTLAGQILEFSDQVIAGEGIQIASRILDSGQAWQKFQAICDAQGGMRTPPAAQYHHVVKASCRGRVVNIDNRQIARLAKLAGAPLDKAAGVKLQVHLDSLVETNQPLFTIYSETQGELRYTLSLLEQLPSIIQVENCE